MAKVLLEDVHGPFMVDRDKGKQGVISEDVGGGLVRHRIPGRFSVCGVTNGNNRRYPRSVWETNLKDGSHLRQLIATRAAFGTLEHPKDGQINLESPISHVVTEALLNETGEVHGEIVIVDYGDNSPGRKLKALIEVGYNPLVSSRGFGSLAPSPDGVDEVQDDYVCEGWDVVYKPSFTQAQLTPERQETTESRKSAPILNVVTETTQPAPKQEAASVTEPSPRGEEPTGAASSVQNQPKRKTMDINTIREQLGALSALVEKKLSAPQIAESFNKCQQLHRDVSAWGAEDGSRSWDATKLHEEIAGIEAALQRRHDAPATELTQLKEQQTKLLKLTKLVTEKAATFKKRLGENMARTASIKETAINAIGRGRDWRKRAIGLQSQVEELDLQLDVVSTTLDMLAEQYNADVVKLSRAKIQTDYKDKLTPELSEALKTATHPDEVYAVLEQLKKPAGKPAPKTESKAGTPAAKSITEAKGGKPQGKPTQESAPSSQPAKEEGVSLPAARDPRSLAEAVQIARRLSAAVVAA